jgi:hypothetical protein
MSKLSDELQAIYDREGRLTPSLVVTAATPPAHPLHSHFEWDDGTAAERYREVQARGLIQRVKVTYREGDAQSPPSKVRAWVATINSYQPVEAVAADPLVGKLALQDIERTIAALQRKWGHLNEFIEIVQRTLNEGAA